MSADWQKYTEFNAVVPCTDKEFRDLMKAGHICIPTKWVLTDKNEHLRKLPSILASGRPAGIARGNFEHIGHEEDIRADSPAAELQSLKESPSSARGRFHSALNSRQLISRTHTSKGTP